MSASTVVEMPQRIAVKCARCKLVQFETAARICRRCGYDFQPPPVTLALAAESVAAPAIEENNICARIGVTIRTLRDTRNLSQRQLAARMGVPRTYVSKVENGKGVPVMASLDKFAKALNVDIVDLVSQGADHRARMESLLKQDKFLSEIALLTTHLSEEQRATFLATIRELARRRVQ